MSDYILEMNHITKEFSGVKALDDVNLKVKKGEIHALCGENGAGKSTLMNVLSGVYPYGTYSGEVRYKGEENKFHNLKDSPWLGLLRRCRNAAFQSSVRDQFVYLRVPCASPFGGAPTLCALS